MESALYGIYAIPNEFRQLSKGAFKKNFMTFCSG